MNSLNSEIICNLSGSGQRDRTIAIRRKLTPFLVKAFYDNGTSSLRFSKPEVTRDTLEELMKVESECCPFFRFDLVDARDHFQLDVSGPTGSEEIVRNFFAVSGGAECGCSSQGKLTGLKTPKIVTGMVGLCVVACAIPPLLTMLGLVSVATGAWLNKGIEGVLIGVALSGLAYFLMQFAQARRRKA